MALDVSSKNGINISLARDFGSFVPEHLFQTGSLAFQSLENAIRNGDDIRERFLGRSGIPGRSVQPDTKCGGETQ
jgi:hypothetical protein